MTTKKRHELTLKDKLSRLTYRQAVKLLGSEGEALLRKGGNYGIRFDEQVHLDAKRFRLDLGRQRVTISLKDDARHRLDCRCSACTTVCEHVGAALSLILEEKTTLGLAVPPPECEPVESLGDKELIRRALDERKERARKEKFTLRSTEPRKLWTDYHVTSAASGKSYCVALRGCEPGESYCSCPDFRKNTLDTCKHILHALMKVKKRFSAATLRRSYKRKHIALHIRYAEKAELRLLLPDKIDVQTKAVVKPVRDRAIDNMRDLLKRIRKLEALGLEVMIYPDAEEWIDRHLIRDRIASKVSEILKDPRNHPLRRSLLKTELLPYQLDGIAFAVGAGRAVLADDMGLGKTVQGIGVAELLRRETGINKALIICPASLKSQWLSEIDRFSDLDAQLVLGSADERAAQYDNDSFFTVCNYEQALRDIMAIERTSWDLIILDEGQRIKNWEAKTSRIVKGLESPFALVLSGTPLENRLDELFSVVEFIDDRRLGPAFRFFNRHRICNEKGKVLGYKDLDLLRENLKPILLRRTRASVMRDLPPRTTEILRIPPTDEQRELHAAHMQTAITIANKSYISEMDLIRLQRALQCCRMSADSTFLVDKQAPGYSSKRDALEDLLTRLSREEGRKIVLFSEWTTMLNLIEPCLKKLKMGYVRLDGSIPQKKRQALVNTFRTDPDCRLFVTTNAGSTGLNLQAADTVINVDLPWNPAVLEQRVGRAHRMGQKRPVQVFVLITEETIEDRLLTTLSSKHELAQAALDPDSNIDCVELACGIDELKQRLEVLVGAKPEAPVDESEKLRVERETAARAQHERVASAGGRFLSATFSLLEELIPKAEDNEETERMAALFRERMADFMQNDDEGRPVLTLTLPDASALDPLANALARIVMMRGESKKGSNGKRIGGGEKPVQSEQETAM